MKLKRCHGCCSALPASCSSPSSPTAPFHCFLSLLSQTARRQCCRAICRQLQKADRLQQNLPQCRPWQWGQRTKCCKCQRCNNNNKNNKTDYKKPQQLRQTAARRDAPPPLCVVIFSSRAGQTFWMLHVAPKIYLLVGLQLHYICRERESGEERERGRASGIGSCAKCRVALSFCWLLWLAEDRQWMPKRMNLAAHFGDPKQHLQLPAIM